MLDRHMEKELKFGNGVANMEHHNSRQLEFDKPEGLTWNRIYHST